MGKFKRAYRCGEHFRQIRESKQLTRQYVGEILFPFATKKSQYNILSQIETNKRGLTIDQANAFDGIAESDIAKMISIGRFDTFDRQA